MNRTTGATILAGVMLLAACSSGGAGSQDRARTLSASVASYELEAGSPQRFLVGLTSNEQELVGYGVYNGLIGHIDKQRPADLLAGEKLPGAMVWDH